MIKLKVVGLKRLGKLEQHLVNKYQQIEFQFYAQAADIPEEERQNIDILIGYDGHVDQSFLESCPNLKWIAWYVTGVNSLPLNYVLQRGIQLTNTRGVQAKQLAEYIVTFILDDYKNMRKSYYNQRHHIYDSTITGKRVSGSTILFLGTGAIAQAAAQLLRPFNPEIIGINRSNSLVDYFDDIYVITELYNVINKADIIINTLPETEETYHLLKRKHFEYMKDNALFINVGRGTIIKENDLLEVMENNLIRHAYLDVFEHEPLSADHPLYDLDNVTITAHITGNDYNNKIDATKIFERNLDHFLNNGKLIENTVNVKNGY